MSLLLINMLTFKRGTVIDGCVSPQNSHVEALIPNVTVYGDRAFTEVITDK